MKRFSLKFKMMAGLCVFFPLLAVAHTGHHDAGGLFAGLTHPFSGLDHLLAMLAVGLWASQLGGKARWGVPAAFIITLLVGGALGMTGVALPYMEAGILASLFILGILILTAAKMPIFWSMLSVGVFALFHGYAHGIEMPLMANALTYSGGFVLASIALHTLGLAGGFALQSLRVEKLARLAGGAVALSGAYLAFA